MHVIAKTRKLDDQRTKNMPIAGKYPSKLLSPRCKTLSEEIAPNEGKKSFPMLLPLKSIISNFFKLDNLPSSATK